MDGDRRDKRRFKWNQQQNGSWRRKLITLSLEMDFVFLKDKNDWSDIWSKSQLCTYCKIKDDYLTNKGYLSNKTMGRCSHLTKLPLCTETGRFVALKEERWMCPMLIWEKHKLRAIVFLQPFVLTTSWSVMMQCGGGQTSACGSSLGTHFLLTFNISGGFSS